jgi:GNAT superfamily N-acetyltransferase
MENFIHDKYGWCYYAIEQNKKPIIFGLFTKLKYRGNGYGKKHLEYVINEIRNTGYVGEIEIEVLPKEKNINKERLIAFYGKLGLKVISI